MDGFYLAAGFLHGFAISLLTYNIFKSRSCHSVAGGTSILYAVVFSCRYLDLSSLGSYPFEIPSLYNDIFKIFFLLSTYLTLYLIYRRFKKTRDESNDTYPIHYLFICAALLTWGTYDARSELGVVRELSWRFSITLEIFAIAPQLSLINKQGFVHKSMVYYLMMMGSYRLAQMCHWLYLYQTEQVWEPITFISGCAQTMIYAHFFVRIYPRLNTEHPCDKLDAVQDIVTVDFAKIDLNEKEQYDAPVIYTIA